MKTRTLATVAVVGPILFCSTVLFQDVLQYDYLVSHGDSPWTTSPVSINALGPYGWMQIVNFGVLGIAVLALAMALRRGLRGSNNSLLGPALIAVWGVEWLLGMFPIERHTHSFSGYMHGISYVTLSLTAVPMYVFMWRHLRRSPSWRNFAVYTLAMGICTLPLEFGSIALRSLIPFSWFYLWLATQLLWCVLLGLRLARAAR
jgi:hypothetical protein